MQFPQRRAAARLLFALAGLGLFTVSSAWGQFDGSKEILTLQEAAMLAVSQQPLLEAQSSAVDAARSRAVAAGQLPDPKLTGGVSDLTVTGSDRYNLRDDSDTQFMVGVTQEFPRAQKRALRAERAEREADVAQAALFDGRLMVQREAALGWLSVWRWRRAADLASETAQQADLQARQVEIAYRSGRATLADWLAARVEGQRMQDALAEAQQEIAHARNELSRWIGVAAERPMGSDLPSWPAPVSLSHLLVGTHHHPHLDVTARETDAAQAGVELARAEYKPDWGVGLSYGYRPNYADYINLEFSMDLPLFTSRRQDQQLAASLAEKARAEQLNEDARRQHESELRLNYADWQLLQDRLARYANDILPQSVQRIEAARLAWQSGQGTLAALLDARRNALDQAMKHLELQQDTARHRLNLLYLAGENP